MLPAARLITRLAWRNVRHRPGQTVLLLIALCLATTSLSLGLAVRETADGSWERLSQATDGFHVYAKRFHRSDSPAEDGVARSELTELVAAPGVAATGGPWLGFVVNGRVSGARIELRVQVRDSTSADVGQPLVASGRWIAPDGDGVVLEDGLASTLDVEPGDTVTLAGNTLPVRGTAMTVTTQRYPLEQPALVWVNEPTGMLLRSGAGGTFHWLELQLDDPIEAGAFVERAEGSLPDDRRWEFHMWQERRDEEEAGSPVKDLGAALLLAGLLLAGLTMATAAILVAGRMAAQTRQVGTLKAVGVTPGQVTAVVLAESVTVAAIATAVGIVAGSALAPVLARSVVTLYGGPQAPPITASRAALMATIAVALVALATARPSLRAARHSTVRNLTATVRPPQRPSRLTALGHRLHVPPHALVGLRSALRRPGRLTANIATLALAIAMVVLGLSIRAAWRALPSTPGWATEDAVARAADQDLYNELLAVVVAATALLIVLAAVNTVITAAFAARDSARNHAILRTFGATPRQTVISFLIAQLGACVLAVAIGILLGVAIFNAWGGDLAQVNLPTRTYLVIALIAPPLYLLTVAAPARLLATQPVMRALAHE